MKLRGLVIPLMALSVASSALVFTHAQHQCSGPFNTLKSDCPGLASDLLCIEYDLREGAPSPCDGRISDSVENKHDCRRSAGATCDVVTYNGHKTNAMVKFHVTFSTSSDSDAGGGIVGGGGGFAGGGFAGGGGFVDSGGFAGDGDASGGGGNDEVGNGDETSSTSRDGSSDGTGDDIGAGAALLPVATTPVLVGGDAAFETEALVHAIGELQLPAEVSDLNLVGGRAMHGTQGRVASVNLDPHMLRRSPHVIILELQNLDVGEQLITGDAIGGFPTGLTELVLRNVMLTSIPSKLASLPNLETIRIEQNALTTIPRDVVLPRVKSLAVTECGLTSFDAVFSTLEDLDLSKNELQGIPDAVFANPKLTNLNLMRNRIASPIVLTPDQVAFFKGLSSIRLDDGMDITQPVLYPIDAGGMPLIPNNNPSSPTAGQPRPGSGSANNSSPVPMTGGALASGRPIGKRVIVHGITVWEVPKEEYTPYKAQQAILAEKTGVTKTTNKKTTGAIVPSDKGTGVTNGSQRVNNTSPGLTATDAAESQEGDGREGSPSQSLGSATNTTASSGNPVGGASGVSTVVNAEDTQDKKSHRALMWTSAIGCVVVASIVLVGIFVSRRRRSRQPIKFPQTPRSPATVNSPASSDFVATTGSQSGAKSIVTSSSSPSPQSSTVDSRKLRDLFSARRLRQADLQDVRPINASASGVVWLVRHRGSRLLASKRLVPSNATPDRMAAFINEIVVVSELEHPSITSLVGVAWSNESDLQALFEYMPNGDLQSHLERMDASAWPWDVAKIRLAIDIVDALVYAHSFNPPLLHRDLRTRHVLLDEANKPKLSGFGSARYASENNTMTTEGVGSGPWLAPEILMGTTDYDSSSDMYAFGVLLCEMDTHATPYGVGDDPAGVAGVLEQVATGKLRPTFTSSCPSAIREVASRCWCQDASARPTAMQVAYELRQLKKE